LQNARAGRAKTLSLLRRHAEALRDWKRALELDGNSGGGPRLGQAIAGVHPEDAAKAVAEADLLAAGKDVAGQTLYDAACVCALAAGKTNDVPTRERYAALAVALLREAVAKGYADLPRMNTDKDLDSLRDRADFRELVAGLGNRQP
jgi:hypothetical protein